MFLYELNTYEQIQLPKAHEAYVGAIGTYPRSDIVVTGGDDKQLNVWNMKEQKIIQKLKSPKTIAAVSAGII